MKLSMKKITEMHYDISRGGTVIGVLEDREYTQEGHRWRFSWPDGLSVTGVSAIRAVRAGLLVQQYNIDNPVTIHPTPLDAILKELIELEAEHPTVGW